MDLNKAEGEGNYHSLMGGGGKGAYRMVLSREFRAEKEKGEDG